jgi:hypothetical protein
VEEGQMAGDHEEEPQAGRQEDWLAIFEAQGVHFLVLDTRRDGDLYQLFRSKSGWTVDFQDGESVLLARLRATGGAPSMARMDGRGG